MKKQPLISIVMPCYKTQWLDTAIASALAQTETDFEIIIGDDCPTNALYELVCKWTDSRIRYVRNAPEDRGFMKNLNHLISLANGKYIKFLWDDDILMPNSLKLLLDIFKSTEAKLAFHQRYRVDEQGSVVDAPTSIVGTGVLEMTPEFFFDHVITHDYNLLGEPSNFMVETDAFKSMDKPFHIYGIENVYYTDLVLFVNFYRYKYKVFGTSEFGSCFRFNRAQGSDSQSPVYSAKFFEREFLRRWCAHLGFLTHKQFMYGFDERQYVYQQHAREYPEFILLENAGKKLLEAHDGYLDDEYLQAVSQSYTLLVERR